MPSRAEIRRQVIDALSRIKESEPEPDAEEELGDQIWIEPLGTRWRIAYFPEPAGGAEKR